MNEPIDPAVVPGVAAMVRKLRDDQLIQALRNVGCYLDACDACAEVFFTGSAMHDHTCRETQPLVMETA